MSIQRPTLCPLPVKKDRIGEEQNTADMYVGWNNTYQHEWWKMY